MQRVPAGPQGLTGHTPHTANVEGAGGPRPVRPQKSHAIRLGEDSTKLENVAIPTL